VAGDTVVVVTSDHGERLFETGRGQGHEGHLLGDESTHVPLIVFDPRRSAPSRAEGIVRDVDVAATLYALTGVSPPGDLDGRSLVPLLDQQPDEPRFAFAESGPPAATDDAALRFPASLGLVAHHRMIRDERFKLVYVPARKRVDYALFDTAVDPEERRDLLFERPDVASRLRPALQRWMLADPRARFDDDLLVPGQPPPSDVVWLAATGPTVALDTLAKRGVRFTHVYPSGRPLLPGQPALDGWGPSQLVVAAPGRLPAGRVVDAPVRDVDLAPTLAELRGLDRDAPPGSRSLVALANREGAGEPEERPIVTERPGVQALLHGHHRLVVRDDRAQLFDVDADPEQHRDLAAEDPARVAELRARLAAALANVPIAGSQAAAPRPRVIYLRFVTAGRAHRVSGVVTAVAGTLALQPVELGPDAVKITGPRAEIAFVTSAAVAVGFDLVVDPPAADVHWVLYLDDQPWPPDATFGGPYGRLARELRAGITSDGARDALLAPSPPALDPRRDLGLFVDRH